MTRFRWCGGPILLGIALLAGTPVAGAQVPTAADRAKAGVGAPVKAEVPAKDLSAQQQAARLKQWRETIRKQLYIPSPLPKLDAKTWSTFSPMPGVLADRVTYATASGMVVPAIIYRPDPKTAQWKGKLPGIVVVNGHGGDKFAWYAFYSGMLLAKAGAVVVTYDPIGEGERNIDKKSRGGSHDKWIDPPAGLPRTDWGQRVAGLMQVDVMQAVSYLATLPEVDPTRIATVGYSMGSFITGITGAIDTRIHAVLLSGGGDFDGPGGYFDSNPLPCQSPPFRSLQVLGDRGAILYALNAARGPMYVMNGAADTVMDIPTHDAAWFASIRERAIAVLGTDKNMFTTVFYSGINHRTSWVNRDGVEWLNQQLHFANWTAKQIATMPVTHVSTWAKANNIDIINSYIQENREGGLDALGTGYPAIKRADLMVLPDKDWQALKNRLTYEAWATKAMAAEARAAH